jgi:hypothetical protein
MLLVWFPFCGCLKGQLTLALSNKRTCEEKEILPFLEEPLPEKSWPLESVQETQTRCSFDFLFFAAFLELSAPQQLQQLDQ